MKKNYDEQNHPSPETFIFPRGFSTIIIFPPPLSMVVCLGQP